MPCTTRIFLTDISSFVIIKYINIAMWCCLLSLSLGARNSNGKYFKLPSPRISVAFNKNPVRAQKWIIRFYRVKSSRWKTWTCCSPSPLDPFLRSSLRHCRNKLIGELARIPFPFLWKLSDDKAKNKWSSASEATQSYNRYARSRHKIKTLKINNLI